jgi:CheY-specific phosphatase CheX
MAEPMSNEKLSDITKQLLEDAAFLFTEPATDQHAPDGNQIVARVNIKASRSVELVLSAEERLGIILAANLLGIEIDSEEARQSASDAVGELANILAGTLAVELSEISAQVSIGIPVVKKEFGATIWKELSKASQRADLLVEDGTRLSIAIKQQGAS